MDLAVVYRPIAELIPYARNARTHSEDKVAQIAGSIKEFGFTNPVLLDGANGILAGHGRVLDARMLGMSRVPCIELAHLSEAQQRRAYILADNKLALNAAARTPATKGCPLRRAVPVPFTEQQIAERLAYGRKHGYSDEQIRAILADTQSDELWKNDQYQVAVRRL